MAAGVTSCATCPCGQAAGVGRGGTCPLVERRRGRDEILAVQGDLIQTVWFVKRGTLVLSRVSTDGAEQPRVIRGPGTFIGLEGLIQATYADTSRTTEPTVVCAISKDRLDAWLGPRGTPARMMLEQTLRVTTDDRPRAAGADGTAVERVARWILDDAETATHVPRHVVAALLGMVPETLSRSLAELRDGGLITLTRRTIAIADRARLEKLAD